MKYGFALPAALLLVACSSSSSPAPAGAMDAGGAAEASSGDGGDTWVSWAKGFFATYCVECHSASDPQGRDYTIQANVEREKAEIRCGVASVQDPAWACLAFPPAKQFPISNAAGTNPKPSDAERARIVAWIAAGAP